MAFVNPPSGKPVVSQSKFFQPALPATTVPQAAPATTLVPRLMTMGAG